MSKFTQDTNGLKVFHRGYWSAVSSEVYYQLQLKILGTVSLLYFDTIHKKLNLQFQELVEVNITYAVLLEFIGWLLHLIQVLLQVRFTTNGICAKNNTHIYVQAIIEWLRRMISIAACCHSVKLCALAARAFRSHESGAVGRIWRSRQVQTSWKEHAISAVHF